MAEGSAASNFDNYITDLHDHLDRLREMPDVDERCSTLVADLAQAYSEQPSPMQTGKRQTSTAAEVKCLVRFQQCAYQPCSPVNEIF